MLLQSQEGLHLFVGDGPWSKITGKLVEWYKNVVILNRVDLQ